jgi:hypothetical protein
LNVYRKGESIGWHGHQTPNYNAWHGFVCVDTEPESYTSYRWPNNKERDNLILDVPSKDGLIVLGLSNGDIHRSSEWQIAERNRVTIAFDIVPSKALAAEISQNQEPNLVNALKFVDDKSYFVNHWVPI